MDVKFPDSRTTPSEKKGNEREEGRKKNIIIVSRHNVHLAALMQCTAPICLECIVI